MNLNYESGKVGDYKGNPVYAIEECKFEPKRANRNFIYALGHQGTSEKLNLIFWDGNHWRQLGVVNATGSDVKENRPGSRPIYSSAEIEVKEEEDSQVRIKEEKKQKKSPFTRAEEIEDLTTLSAGIDRYIQEQLNRDY